MTDRQFFDWQTDGGGNDVVKLVAILEEFAIPWCMIGGLAVNHWAVEPMVTQDVDLVVALDRVEDAVKALESIGFKARTIPYSVNLEGSSRVSVQLSTDDVYREFPSRSLPADIHGILMRVASLQDTLAGKILAFSDPGRRPSKRQKDLADIARLIESHPEVANSVPAEILSRIAL